MADETVQVLVTLTDGDDPAVAATLEALRSAGLRIERVMDDLGIVSGAIERRLLASLREIPGVSVEEAGGVQLPPPDSDLQ